MHVKSRFIALFLILALSAGFYIGFAETDPLMRNTADDYFEITRLADFRLLSDFGITDADVAAIRERPEIAGVMPSYDVDVIGTKNNDAKNTSIYSIHSLPVDTSEDNPDYLSRVTIVSGKMPAAANECLISDLRESNSKNITKNKNSIGDTITINSDNDEMVMERLVSKTYTVVGIAKSPQYISVDLGNTNVGDGLIDDFIYLPDEAFNSEIYTAVYVSLKTTEGLSAFSEEYQKTIDDEKTALTSLADSLGKIRYADVISEAEEKLASGEKEYNEGKKEAEKGLSDARKLLDDNARLLKDGKAEYAAKEKEYLAGEKKLNEGKAAFAKGSAVYSKGKAEYDKQKAKYDKGLADYNKGLATYNKGKATYDKGSAAYDKGLTKYNKGKATYATEKDKYDKGLITLADAKKEYKKSYEEYEILVEQSNGRPSRFLEMMKERLDEANDKIKDGEKELADGKKELAKAEKELTAAEKELAKAKKELTAAKKELTAGKKELAAGKKELTAGEKELAKAKKELAEGEKELADARREISKGEKELSEGKKALDDAKEKIADGEKQLAEGEKQYADKKKEADTKLADAEKQIADGRKAIEDLAPPAWYVFDRSANSEYSSFKDAAGKMKALSLSLPIFMYLIAGLICITSITRMIEEDRLQIGTLKALGYRKRQILVKYLVYAGSVGILGGTVGVFAGLQIFPRAIWRVYAAMYTLGDVNLVYGLSPVLIGILSGTIVVVATALATCLRELNSSASTLMRPKAPPAGKRVLIERIGIIWNRLSFSGKVTARNAFRYKRRFIAAIIGVTGCMALLMTGFGLNDSISGVVDLQYGRVIHSEVNVILNKPGTEAEQSDINEKLKKYGEYTYVYDISVVAARDDVEAADTITYLYVPESPERFRDFVSLQNRKSKSEIAFPTDNNSTLPSVVITEKIADTLGVNNNDVKDRNTNSTISFGLVNEEKVSALVTGIAENYFNNYIYLTPDGYEKLYGSAPQYNSVLLQTEKLSDDELEELLNDLINTDGVLSAYSSQQARDTIDGMLNSFSSVIWIIVIVAAFLAIIVLYSLANINVRERTRELATLKVLGFLKKEIYSYILQENMLLTVLGIIIGIPVGIFLHRYVLSSVEGADVMLGRDISLQSIVLSGVFTLISMLVVNLLMRPTINKIDPAVSLKSIQ